jgi:hypothetical protein
MTSETVSRKWQFHRLNFKNEKEYNHRGNDVSGEHWR